MKYSKKMSNEREADAAGGLGASQSIGNYTGQHYANVLNSEFPPQFRHPVANSTPAQNTTLQTLNSQLQQQQQNILCSGQNINSVSTQHISAMSDRTGHVGHPLALQVEGIPSFLQHAQLQGTTGGEMKSQGFIQNLQKQLNSKPSDVLSRLADFYTPLCTSDHLPIPIQQQAKIHMNNNMSQLNHFNQSCMPPVLPPVGYGSIYMNPQQVAQINLSAQLNQHQIFQHSLFLQQQQQQLKNQQMGLNIFGMPSPLNIARTSMINIQQQHELLLQQQYCQHAAMLQQQRMSMITGIPPMYNGNISALSAQNMQYMQLLQNQCQHDFMKAQMQVPTFDTEQIEIADGNQRIQRVETQPDPFSACVSSFLNVDSPKQANFAPLDTILHQNQELLNFSNETNLIDLDSDDILMKQDENTNDFLPANCNVCSENTNESSLCLTNVDSFFDDIIGDFPLFSPESLQEEYSWLADSDDLDLGELLETINDLKDNASIVGDGSIADCNEDIFGEDLLEALGEDFDFGDEETDWSVGRSKLREIAKITRARRKAFVERLEKTADILEAEVEKRKRNEIREEEIELQRVKNMSFLSQKMLGLWWNGETGVEVWEDVVTAEVAIKVPDMPFRSNICNTTRTGIEILLQDMFCTTAMLQTLGHCTAKGILRLRMSAEVIDGSVKDDVSFMCRWRAFTDNAILCGGSKEVEISGMMHVKFKTFDSSNVDQSNKKVNNFSANAQMDSSANNKKSLDQSEAEYYERPDKRMKLTTSDTLTRKANEAYVLKRSGWQHADNSILARAEAAVRATQKPFEAKNPQKCFELNLIISEVELIFDVYSLWSELAETMGERLERIPTTMNQIMSHADKKDNDSVHLIVQAKPPHAIDCATKGLAKIVGSQKVCSLVGRDLISTLGGTEDFANGLQQALKWRPSWVRAGINSNHERKDITVYVGLYPLSLCGSKDPQPIYYGEKLECNSIKSDFDESDFEIEPIYIFCKVLITEQSVKGSVTVMITEVASFMQNQVENTLASHPIHAQSMVLSGLLNLLKDTVNTSKMPDKHEISSRACSEREDVHSLSAESEDMHTLALLVAFWAFYLQLELRDRQLKTSANGQMGIAVSSKKDENVNLQLDDHVNDKSDCVDFDQTLEEKVVTELMSVVRRWFCEGRRGVLVDCLFDLIRCTSNEALASIAQEYIWASWNSHEDKDVVREMQCALNHMARNNFCKAIDALNRAIALDPMHAEIRNRLSTAMFLSDDLEGAKEEATRVIALEPRHFGALNGLAIMCMRNHDYTGALEYLQQVAEINPFMNRAMVQKNIAVCRASIQANMM